MRTNFGVEKIWQFWQFWFEIAKLSPHQKIFFRHCQIKSTPNLFFYFIAKLNPR